MVPVKICGLTREADVAVAVEAGASALGVILWAGSPRGVSPERARTLFADVPPHIARVGVFVNAEVGEVRRAIDAVGLDVVQLHGDEPVDVVRTLGCDHLVLRAISSTQALADAERCSVDEPWAWLVDAHDPVRRGGTGQRADWHAAAALARRRRIVLAGGIDAESAQRAYETVRPAAFDVSSGVERAPGVKDHELIDALLRVTQALPGAHPSNHPASSAFVDAVFGGER